MTSRWLYNHGFAATRDEAKAAFAATWRAWLARSGARNAATAPSKEK